MRLPLAAFALVALALAGCSDEPSGPAAGAGDAVAPGTSAADGALLAPTWRVGDWWNLSSEQSAAGFSHVVSGEDGDDWVVDTDSTDIAFFDARFDISFLGKVRKADLAGSQGTQRVEFLRFPLTAGLNWTTDWDGVPVTVTATKVARGIAELNAVHANGTPYASYSYSDKERYFTRFTFYAPDGASVGFEWSLAGSGATFDRALVRWEIEEVLNKAGPLPPAESGTYPVASGTTDVFAEIHYSCTVGTAHVAAGVATGTNIGEGYGIPGSVCPAAVDWAGSLAQHQEGNQWAYILQSTGGGPAPAGEYSIQAWQRVLTTFTAGAAP